MVEGFDEDSTAEPLDFVAEGIRLFAMGHYFEAHDVWEELWQRLRGQDRLYLQGLIHIAVGAYHHGSGNLRGARSQWGKARRKISPYPPGHWGIDTGDWMKFFEQIENRPEIPELPGALRFETAHFPTDLSVAQA